MQRNYYQILGVVQEASADEIRRAYRALIQQHHPDRHVLDEQKLTAAEEMAKQINMAYHVLSDPKTRRKYDQDLHYGVEYAAANQSFTEPPIKVVTPQPYRPQFRWKTEPPPSFTSEQQRWIIAFIVLFICCSLFPFIWITVGGDNINHRFTPTPEPTITATTSP